MERRKRRRRDPATAKRPYTPTRTALQALPFFATYRYLTARMIAGLLGKKSTRHTHDVLKDLKHHRYLRDYEQADELPRHWPDPLLLDRRGEELLIAEGFEPDFIIRRYRARAHKRPNFRHDFAACQVMSSIHAGALGSGVRVKTWQAILENAELDDLKIPCTVRHTFPDGTRYHKDTVWVPDHCLGLIPGKHVYLTLELERGNRLDTTKDLEQGSSLRKFLVLKDIHARAGWTESERRQPMSARPRRGYRELLNISNLRTLFVYPSEARMRHAIDICARVLGRNNYCLFGWMDYTRPSTWPGFYDYSWQRVGLPATNLMNETVGHGQN